MSGKCPVAGHVAPKVQDAAGEVCRGHVRRSELGLWSR